MSNHEHGTEESEQSHYRKIRNEARDYSQVGSQAGVNYGSMPSFFGDHYYGQESPEEQRRRAITYLSNESPRAAEQILEELMLGRQPTTEIAYYYALSVLGGRSFYEIDHKLVEKIKRAWQFCSPRPDDPWREALDVVMVLLRCLPLRGAGDGASADTAWETQLGDLRAFEKVPVERQDEIRQNLALIASGRARECLEEGVRERVLAKKIAGGRAARVWKFFEPEPLEPRPYPLPSLDAALPGRRPFAGAALFLAAGAALLALDRWWLAIPVLAVLLTSAWLLTSFQVAPAARQLFDASLEREARRLRTLREPASPGHWVPSQLAKDMSRVVEDQFKKARRHRAGIWEEQTVEVRAYLKERLVTQYGNARRSADAVAWLAHWYARRAATEPGAAWQPPDADEAESEPVETASPRGRLWLGAVAPAATLGTLIAVGQLPAALMLLVGTAWIAVLGRRLSVFRHAIDLRTRAEQRVLAADMEGLAHWQKLLEDRPHDDEMARWLAMDKAHLRLDAIERAGLTRDDVVTHVVMTERAADAREHQWPDRPVRCSVYVVRVFLLTYSGVQEVTARLDFASGDILNERRRHFSYTNVACADTAEKGARGVREVKREPVRNERLRAVSFTLRLVNGEEAVSVRETFRRPDRDVTLDDEDDDLVSLVADDDSGFASVLRVLETVASEGGAWIRRDRERRERWAHSLFDEPHVG